MLILLMQFIIVFVHYLFWCTRLKPFLYLLFILLVNSEFSLQKKTYKYSLVISFPFLIFQTVLKMVFIITVGILELILVGVFNV